MTNKSPYAVIFSVPGTKIFCFSAAIARLPMSVGTLGIVLALNSVYNNWTIAGSMSAVYVLAASCVTPLYAYLFDKFGQYQVGRVVLLLQIIASLSFAISVFSHAPLASLYGLVIGMGLTQFAYGALVRTRWAAALAKFDNASLLNTAYAMESGIDEIIYILGPIIAGFLATTVHPLSPLLLPPLASGIGGTIFFLQKSTQPVYLRQVEVDTSHAQDVESFENSGKQSHAQNMELSNLKSKNTHSFNIFSSPVLLSILVVFLVFNISFDAFYVTITAVMKQSGMEQFLGLQLALFSVGSCIGAFIFGSKQLNRSLWAYIIIFLSLLTIGYFGFSITLNNLILLGVLEILVSFCVSPLFTVGNLIVKQHVPESFLTEGLSWVSTVNSIGVAIGASLAGRVIDMFGTQTAIMIPWISTALAIPLAVCGLLITKKIDGAK